MAKVKVQVMMLTPLRRSRAEWYKEMKHMVLLLAGFWCRKDTLGSFAVFLNSLASSDDILRFEVVASSSFKIGDVSSI